MTDGKGGSSPILRRLLRLRLWLVDVLRPSDLHFLLMWAVAVGVVGATASQAFKLAFAGVHELLTGRSGGYVADFALLNNWQRVLVPTLGGALAGVVLHVGVRLGTSPRTSDYMEAVVVGDGLVSFRKSAVKCLSALFSGASGASIGREGPLVQLSAMLSSLPGQWLHLSLPKRRELVACGAAAGIASAYNAPIAGAFFVAEIVVGSLSVETIGPLVVASVAATLVTRAVEGPDALYEAPSFALHSYWEMAPYAALGIVCGALAPIYLRFLRGSEAAFQRLPLHIIGRLALGGALVGCLAIVRPEVCGNGYDVVNSVLHRTWLAEALLLVLVLKVVATGITFGSGAVGGVFTPTLLTGAAVGHLFAQAIGRAVPYEGLNPSAYALVGMGAFLAAATGAPLMAIVMVFELTLDYQIMLPLMLACVLGHATSRPFEKQFLYGQSLERKGASLVAEKLRGMRVVDLMRTRALKVARTASFREIAQAFLQNRFNYIYVVGDDDRYLGAVSLHDIKAYLDEPDLAQLVIAEDIQREDFPCLPGDLPLSEALSELERSGSERLPVVESAAHPRLIGSLAKTDLLLHLTGQRRGEGAGEGGAKR